ncbi:hypothetical protein SGPA1_21430 [Streptomyces misionensis JCM 4497]
MSPVDPVITTRMASSRGGRRDDAVAPRSGPDAGAGVGGGRREGDKGYQEPHLSRLTTHLWAMRDRPPLDRVRTPFRRVTVG